LTFSAGIQSDRDFDEFPSDDDPSSEDEATSKFSKIARRLTLHELDPLEKGDRSLDSHVRFHGSSSSWALVDITRQLKMLHLAGGGGNVADSEARTSPAGHQKVMRREEFWKAPPVSSLPLSQR
jgi:hypothetical protein